MSEEDNMIAKLVEKVAGHPEANCPHCGKELTFEVKAKLMDKSKMSFTITPHEGELLGAKTVGGSIENVAALLSSIGDSMGTDVHVMVSGLRYEAGAVTVDLLVARQDKGVGKRKRAAA